MQVPELALARFSLEYPLDDFSVKESEEPYMVVEHLKLPRKHVAQENDIDIRCATMIKIT